MTAEEVKTIREEVEHRYYEQNLNEMCELYKKIKVSLSISDDMVAKNILDYGSWDEIEYILSQIKGHPEWKEVFPDEIDRLERNREYFVKRNREDFEKRKTELYMDEHKLPWWKKWF